MTFHPIQWCRVRWKRVLAIGFIVAIFAFNLAAYLHARAFTHYAPPGSRLTKPETMSVFQKIGVCLAGASHPRPVNDRSPKDVGLEFTTHFISGDDVKLEVWHVPCAHAHSLVLLFHGHGACKSSLLPETRALHDLGCECLLVDFRAGGGSTGDVCTLGVAEAHDVSASVALARNLNPHVPIVLFGQSMGSAAILRTVGQNLTTADALILESPFDRLLTTVQHRFEAIGFPEFPMARLLVFWGGVQHGFDAFAHNPAEYAKNVRAPTLIMHGDRDPRVQTGEAEAVASALAGPKTFHVFREAGHQSYLCHCPEEWRSLVDQFLRGLPR